MLAKVGKSSRRFSEKNYIKKKKRINFTIDCNWNFNHSLIIGKTISTDILKVIDSFN